MRGIGSGSSAIALAALLLAAAPPASAGDGASAPAVAPESGSLIDEAQRLAASGDAKGARELMEKAAATGDAEAINGLATFVAHGVGGEPDAKRARELLERAAAAGSIGARLNLALQLQGSDDEAEQARAFELLRPIYAKPPDRVGGRAVKAVAAGGLGIAYVFGRGTAQDVARGVRLLEECEAGGAAWDHVTYLLARAYESGWGGHERNPEKAYEHWWALANRGNAQAQWRVAMSLLAGDGAPLDEPEAYRWARKAAEAGDTNGELSTAVMLALGQGVEENDTEARSWYERAANQGSAHGLRGLGFMLITGEGGPRDAARGWAYVSLAAEAGDAEAKAALAEGSSEVTPADREAAKPIAEAWSREHGKLRSDD